MSAGIRRPQDNPFSVDRVSALPFVGRDVSKLVRRFERMGFNAAILGTEGVGKSTLMRSIGRQLARRGVKTAAITLPGSASFGQRREAVRSCEKAPTDVVVLFDGFEQLGFFHRRKIRRRPRLLATIHRPIGIPVLTHLRPRWRTMRRLLRRVLTVVSVEAETLAKERFAAHHCDIRATFFDLYDAWQAGQIGGVACSAAADAAITPGEP